MKYIFFTALWEGQLGHSKAYFDYILDWQLRIIEEELRDEEIEYHIVCPNQIDANAYNSIISRDSRYSSLQLRLSVVPVSDGLPPQIKLNYLSQQFIKERENSGDVLVYNVPDYVYSKNTLKWVRDNIQSGKSICSIYTPKVIRELALLQIKSFNSIELWNSVKDILHEGHLKQFTDSEIGFIRYPSGIYVRTANGHTCIPITMHPFAFRLDRQFEKTSYVPSMSIEQGVQSSYRPEEFAIQSSIEEFIILELTKMELPWADDTDYSGYSHELINSWCKFGEMGNLQRFFLDQQVFFGDVPNDDDATSFQKGLLEYLDANYFNSRNK